MMFVGLWSLLHIADAEPTCPKGAIKKHGKVDHQAINEASGLVVTDNWLWIHNDSGDSATLYAIDKKGEKRATSSIEGAFARDWEDMTTFSENGKPYILIGDIGDNKERRPFVDFYVIEQPTSNTNSALLYTFKAKYKDIGSKDTEAIVVDPKTNDILVFTKGRDGIHHVLTGAFPLPSSVQQDAVISDVPALNEPKFNAPEIELTEIHQQTFATLPLNRQYQSRLITSASISPDGEWLAVRNYLSAKLYHKTTDQEWNEVLQTKPCRLPLPLQQQGETLAFSPDGNSLWTVSEGERQTIYEIQLVWE